MTEAEKAISEVDASLENLIKHIKEKHEEFEMKFNVLYEIKNKNDPDAVVNINLNRIKLVLADYPKLASWYLGQFEIANTRLKRTEEKYSQWYGPRAKYAEQEMKNKKEHITQATIKTKVAILYRDEYVEWQDKLAEIQSDKDMLEKRLGIIHDARYTLNALSILRPIWSEATRGDSPVDADTLNAADAEMRKQ